MDEKPKPNHDEAAENETNKTFERSTVVTADGWLNTFGYFTKCESTEHDESADFILKGMGSLDYYKERGIPSRNVLKQEGYVQMAHNIPQIKDVDELRTVQLEALNKSGIAIPFPTNSSYSQEFLDHFKPAYEGQFTINEANYINAMLESKNGWGNKITNWYSNTKETSEKALSILSKLTSGMTPKTRIVSLGIALKGRREMQGTSYQYWVDESGKNAIWHAHYVHDGQSASVNPEAEDYHDTIRVCSVEWAEETMESIKKNWEGRGEISTASTEKISR